MALALNNWVRPVGVVSTTPQIIYTAPVGYTGVVLLSQISNIGDNSQDINFYVEDNATGIAVTTTVHKNLPIANNDAVSLVKGKLALKTGDKLILQGSHASDLTYLFTILETLE
jgi:hypothetical protein